MLIQLFSCHSVLITGWQGLEDLKGCSQKLVRSGNRVSTQKTYSSTQKQYLEFCDHYTLCPVPATEEVLLLYVSHLFRVKKLRYTSIYVHLASIRSLHIVNGWSSPLENTPRLKLALRSMEISSTPVKQKLPISINMLYQIYSCLDQSYNSCLIWSAMTLGHFGLLRSAEFTVPGKEQFNKSKHLLLGDVGFKKLPDGTDYMVVTIKSSKTDRQNRGFSVIIGCNEHVVCAYCYANILLNVLCWLAQIGLYTCMKMGLL